MAIRYLKEHLMETVRKSTGGVDDNDVLYLLTVPAIWSDAAKQFMTEAALKATIDRERLKLVLQPEAASAWCQNVPASFGLKQMKVGEKYMVAELGGGTADITVHEKLKDNVLKEIHRASGGDWGGTKVDARFFNWMSILVGEESFARFQVEEPADYLELELQFEFKKRELKSEGETPKMKLPASILEIHEEVTNTTLKETVRQQNTKGLILERDKLNIPAAEIRVWFMETISAITSHIQSVLRGIDADAIKTIMLVGGFSECKILQKRLASVFRNKQILIPIGSDVAVLKGALTMGLKPDSVASRITRYAYGIAKPVDFDGNLHEPSKSVWRGEKIIVELFEKFIDVNDEVDVDEVISKGFYPIENESTVLRICASSDPNTKYITDREVIGKMEIHHPDGETIEDKFFSVNFAFGKTELVVKVVMRKSGEEFKTNIEFM